MNTKRSARMLRVDQAGEYGATQIYAGQLAVMGNRAPLSGEIAAMAAHPILIERPIVVTGKGTVLCRPPERVAEVL